jgi:putative endonuclease
MAERDAALPADPAAKSASPARMAAGRAGSSAQRHARADIAKGYRILAKRFRARYGEIDIVVKRRNLFSSVEVTARAKLDDAVFAVTSRQKSRMIDAASARLMAHPGHGEFELRSGAMRIASRHLPRHVLAAFDARP